MKSTIEHNINTARQHPTIVVATMVVAKQRQQFMLGMYGTIPYAQAVAIATPAIEAWEAYVLDKAAMEAAES